MRPTASALCPSCSAFIVVLAALGGCTSETVVHGLSEKEANQVIELLADTDISAQKLLNSAGREVVYDIAVPGSQRFEAIKTLNEHEMPRRRDRGYKEIFAESGLIPTSSEEKAKRLAALEGEIERQLKLVDGVLDVEVQIVTPEESALRATNEHEPATTASVTMKYLPRGDGKRPLSESEVQSVVAAGVEKLMPEHVVVLMRAVEIPPPDRSRPPALLGLRLGPRTLTAMVVGVGALLVLLVVGLILSQLQLRNVRGRLVRLQTEIAKARKKPQEALPPTGTAG